MARFFHEMKCGCLRTGAEAVLDLKKPHLKRKTVASSLSRGKKQGYTEELVPNEVNLNMLDAFRKQTRHADKPQLMNLFRDEPDPACRLFVFRNFEGNWLAAMTLSGRGRNEMHTELILRHKNAPGDIMESLVAGIFMILENEGMHEWSLGEVPFIFHDEIRTSDPDSLEKLMLSFAAKSRYAYDHESLFRFKNKFAPEWRTVTLCSNISPSALMLGELAVSMGYGNLLVHQSFSVLKKLLIPF
ncbi:MAG: DUF2156 domain-containing protein [Chlorobiaceae bacterium]|nr:DUF2156 domain-containing protein [Chlorobiaceae bacterium]